MNQETPRPSAEQIEVFKSRLESLDLEPLKVKLMDSKEGPGWTLTQADMKEDFYKKFLLLNFMYPDKRIVPTVEIDQFWHYHILDTRKYAQDCEELFGYFLHHFPYFGLRGEDDAKNLEKSFQETMNLFEQEFGQIPVSLSAMCSCGGSGGCDYGAIHLDSDRPRPDRSSTLQ